MWSAIVSKIIHVGQEKGGIVVVIVIVVIAVEVQVQVQVKMEVEIVLVLILYFIHGLNCMLGPCFLCCFLMTLGLLVQELIISYA